MSITINSIQLRRGTQEALETVLVSDRKPLVGEPIWESDTNRLKIGNGVDNYIDLPYISDSDGDAGVYVGYYYNGEFYEDDQHTIIIGHTRQAIYLDLGDTGTYFWSSTNRFLPTVPLATSSVAGISKLYNSLGQNTDGSCTQKVVSDEIAAINTTLASKVSVDVNQANECLVFLT